MEFVEQQQDLMLSYLACKVKGLDKNQDIAYCGRANFEDSSKNYDWFVGCDGHGKIGNDNFIEILKKVDWTNIMRQENSLDALLYVIKDKKYNFQTGSTYYEAKIYNNRVEICSVGDSKIKVFVNKQIVYSTTPHNLKNQKERERLRERIEKGKMIIEKCENIPEMQNSNTIKFVKGEYYYFDNKNTKLAMTQSLGHNNITGLQPEKEVIHFEEGLEVQVIGGSDGLWDVVMENEVYDKDVDTLLTLAESRWIGEWNIDWNGELYQDKFPIYDDITVCICKNNFEQK
jgi:serine/threonine protein phosphatase PrpC